MGYAELVAGWLSRGSRDVEEEVCRRLGGRGLHDLLGRALCDAAARGGWRVYDLEWLYRRYVRDLRYARAGVDVWNMPEYRGLGSWRDRVLALLEYARGIWEGHPRAVEGAEVVEV